MKSIIAYHHRVNEIVNKQAALVKEYKRPTASFKKDTHFTEDEILHMGSVYAGIIDESLKNADQLFVVIKYVSPIHQSFTYNFPLRGSHHKFAL